MRILFWQWNAFMQKGMEKAMKRLNVEYDVLYHQPKDWERDEVFEKKIKEELAKGLYDKVLSVNYCPIVSKACQNQNVTYIAWVYDSPIHIRDISSFKNECNRIYFFDRGQVQRYESMGFTNIYHLPLAVDETVWDMNNDNLCKSDVAMVGQLYKSDFNYLLGPLDQYNRGLLEGYISAQEIIYGAYLLEDIITDSKMEELNKIYCKASGGKVSVKKAELEYACACEITGRERFKALHLLSQYCSVDLYSGNVDNRLKNVNQCEYVDYYSKMPDIFRSTKINLNISLKTIRTGIPLRVLDVLSCGGFLVTNYQEELFEYFEPGVDIVVYEDIKDLVYKVRYYLEYEEERKIIAMNGRRKVLEYFDFDSRMKKLLEI